MMLRLHWLRRPMLYAFGTILGSAAALSWPGRTGQIIRFVIDSFFDVAPIICFGLILSAWVSASGAGAVTARLFQGRQTVSIIIASAIGAVTPVCGVTILPLMTGLLRTGVPLAPIMAFWIASPVTDPGLFAATWAVLGPEFAIGKTFAGLALGLFAGFGTNAFASTDMVQRPVRTSVRFGSRACGAGVEPIFLLWIWDDSVRMRSFWGELAAMAKLVTICLGLAFAAEALLRDLIPTDVLASHIGGDSPYGILLATTVAAPLYVDGYAALPLIHGLLDLGMSPGAAMAFLVAGSAMSIWGILAVAPVLRASTAGLFVAFAVTGCRTGRFERLKSLPPVIRRN